MIAIEGHHCHSILHGVVVPWLQLDIRLQKVMR